MKNLVIVLIAAAALAFFLFRPVCVRLTEQDLQSFNVPIEQRADQNFYLTIFQNRNGEWHQCKTWLSRFLFF